MAVFVTLCETYMGIESHFNLWNYFRVWLQQGSGMEVAALGSMDIFVRPVHGVDPNFHLPTSSPPNGWWKVWFFLRNNTDAPLPIFMSSCHVPRPNWGYGVAQKDLRKLQPLWEVVRKLLQGRLTGVELLQTFFSNRVQLLYHQEVTMWMYPGPSCPDRPFSVELGDTEINTRIQGVLA
jgi:hypothetical protein